MRRGRTSAARFSCPESPSDCRQAAPVEPQGLRNPAPCRQSSENCPAPHSAARTPESPEPMPKLLGIFFSSPLLKIGKFIYSRTKLMPHPEWNAQLKTIFRVPDKITLDGGTPMNNYSYYSISMHTSTATKKLFIGNLPDRIPTTTVE